MTMIANIDSLWSRVSHDIESSIKGFDVTENKRMKTRSIIRRILPKSISNRIRALLIPALKGLEKSGRVHPHSMEPLMTKLGELLETIETVQHMQMEMLRGIDNEAYAAKKESIMLVMKDLQVLCMRWGLMWSRVATDLAENEAQVENNDDSEEEYVEEEFHPVILKRPSLFSYIESRRSSRRPSSVSNTSVDMISSDTHSEPLLEQIPIEDNLVSHAPTPRNLSDALDESMREFEQLMCQFMETSPNSPVPPQPFTPKVTTLAPVHIPPSIVKKVNKIESPPPPVPDKDSPVKTKKGTLPRILIKEESSKGLPFSPIPFIGNQYHDMVLMNGTQTHSNRSSAENVRDSLQKKSKALKSELKYVMQYDDFLDAYEETESPHVTRQSSLNASSQHLPSRNNSPKLGADQISFDHQNTSTQVLPDLKKAKKILKKLVGQTFKRSNKADLQPRMEIGMPTEVKHLGHIGKDTDGSIIALNIPSELKHSSIFIR